MSAVGNDGLLRLVAVQIGDEAAAEMLSVLQVDERLHASADANIPRATIAQAVSISLLHDLLMRVPAARSYVAEQRERGRRLILDHGAVRTIYNTGIGTLPPGIAAFERLLLPLGYTRAAEYPLTALGMHGCAFRHSDVAEGVSQFFVSELYPTRFSRRFQAAVSRIVATSIDPLTEISGASLTSLSRNGSLGLIESSRLLKNLCECFRRLHQAPLESDYELLLIESPEMAWISTEGNTFNHATDRVADIESLVREQREIGRPMKDTIEVSGSGRVRQTAYPAARVSRDFRSADGTRITRVVPGSFFEFIQRDPLPDGSGCDLAFDAGNAQGIFSMTAAHHA